MKKSKALIVGIISGLLCAGCVFLFMQTVQSEAAEARAEVLSRYGGEQIEVCVASRDISAGESIGSHNTTTKLWVADLLPDKAVRSLDDVAGKQATSNILTGEVISEQRFEEQVTSFEVPKGLSALSVPAKEVQTVGGALKGGMRVDLYATGTQTDLLARNVLILETSAGSSEGRSGGSATWVTLALDPESIEEIIAASQKMELYFVLPGTGAKGVS